MANDPKREDPSGSRTPGQRPTGADIPSNLDLSAGAGRTSAPLGSRGDLGANLDLSAGAGPTGSAPLSDAQSQALPPGTLLAGRYEVRAVLGTGGMGAVYRVHDRLRKTDVALKVMLPSLLAREKAVERFAHEAEIMLRLSHEGIVRVFDVGEHAARGLRFFTMELLEGMSLRQWLDEKKRARGPVAAKEALEITRQLLEALRYAHRATVHRDLKPENVFLLSEPDGALRVKILDFGIAKLQSASAFTSTSMALGTAYYMAPEQQVDSATVDARADLYALSVILYEMLTAELPIGAVKTPSVERRAKIEEWGGPRPDDAAALPRGIDDLVMRGLERKPERRPESAERMLAEIAAIRVVLEGARTRRSLAPLLAALLFVAAASGVALLVRPWEGSAPRDEPRPPAPPPPLSPPVEERPESAALPAPAPVPVPPAEAPAPAPPAEAPAPAAAPPVTFLALDPPAGQAALLREPAIRVRGRVSDPGIGAVRLGEPGKRAIEKPLDAEGRFDVHLGLDPDARAVEVRAGDALATIPLEIDAAPPEVSLEVPAKWREGPLAVAATVRAAHPLAARFTLLAGGKEAAPALERPVGADGRATAAIEVPAEAARGTAIVVRVEAEDALGRSVRAEREVAIERPPPPAAARPPPPSPAPAAEPGPAPAEADRRARERPALSLEPARAEIALGEAIEVRVEFRNVGPEAYRGPVLALDDRSVRLAIAAGGPKPFSYTRKLVKPLETRSLPAGQSWSKTISFTPVSAGEYAIGARYANANAAETNVIVRPASGGATDLGAALHTTKGDLLLRLFPEVAPNQVAHFAERVREGFYDGLGFHRVIRGFMAQGGDPQGTGAGGPGYTIAAEFTNDPKYSHSFGRVSTARAGGPDSGGSQFFLCFDRTPFLDGKYTVFGELAGGQEALRAIEAAAVRDGEKPNEIVKITKAALVPLAGDR